MFDHFVGLELKGLKKKVYLNSGKEVDNYGEP